MKKLRVLVGCEFSGIVRDAFASKGHDAWSCDLLPTERPGNHYEGNVTNILNGLPLCLTCGEKCKMDRNSFWCDSCGKLWPFSFPHKSIAWDLMIAHPPCTYFANAGLHYLNTQPERIFKLKEALLFLTALWNAPIKRIAIENPPGWLNTNWRQPHQIIQPYFFGSKEMKTTCLWLKGLPILLSFQLQEKPSPTGFCIRKSGKQAGKKYNYYFRQSKSAHDRSRTFPEIAQAMADQWG